MLAFIDKILTFVITLGFLVFVHELGHFAIAKLFRVPVFEFAFGLPFGPKIRLFRRGGTDYTLRPAVPLGGFVAFADPEASEEDQLDQMEQYHQKPVWQRFLVILAGPIASLGLGWLLFVLFAGMYGIESGNPVLKQVVANRPAAIAGLKAGDEVLAVNGDNVTQSAFIDRLSLSAGHPVTLKVRRPGTAQPMTFTLTPREEYAGKQRVGRIGVVVGGSEHRPVSGIGEAFSDGTLRTSEYLKSLKTVFSSFRTAKENVGGPVGIASAVSQATEIGFPAKVMLAAQLSLGLFVFNCFIPIPALDCGQMVLLVIEAIRRRRLSLEQQSRVMIGSWAFLLVFVLFATFNDITRLLPTPAPRTSPAPAE
ncbi:MAG: M50 family metallopeptidase [Armatimonas sp.]